MKKTNAVWYVVIALTIWCTWNSVGKNNLVTALSYVEAQQEIMVRETAYMTDRLYALENAEPEVIVKEIIKEVEVPVEIIKEVEVIKEVMIKDTTEGQEDVQ